MSKHEHIFVDLLKRKRQTKTFLITNSEFPKRRSNENASTALRTKYSISTENTQKGKHIFYLFIMYTLQINFERAIRL